MTDLDEREELRKLLDEIAQEAALPIRDRWQRRVDRIIARRPGLLREAARKALAEEHLSEDEFVLAYIGNLPDEWTDEMESEWHNILVRHWESWID